MRNLHFFGVLSGSEPEEPLAWRSLWLIVAFSLAFRIFLASVLPLVADEAYAIAVAREYSISFFDHPPVSFWLPEIMRDLTGLTSPLIYRAPFLLAGSGTTVVMFLIGREIAGNRAGIWSALLYSAAPFFLASGGMFVVPDGPLYLASSLSVYFVLKVIGNDAKPVTGPKPVVRLWILAGLALAVALASKYQAAWIPAALLLFMLIDKDARRWFLTPGPWLCVAIGGGGLIPVVLWNADHHWASFAFHEGRAGGGLNPLNFLRLLVVQALMLLPVSMLASVAGFGQVFRGRARGPLLFLALVALGPIVIFNAIYLTSNVPFAHWAMPGWIFLLPLAGAWLAKKPAAANRRFVAWTSGFLITMWSIILILVLHAATGVLTRPFYDAPPKWDRTAALFDIRGLKAALNQRGLLEKNDFLMTDGWIDAGIIDTALDGKLPMEVFNIKAAHHFAYLSDATTRGRGLMLRISLVRDAIKNEKSLLAAARTLDAGAKPLRSVILKRGSQDYVAVALVTFFLAAGT